jgi:ABC-type polysaccharide/polyol phosphate transport system, ATPase component
MPEPVVTVENLGKSYWLYPNVWRRLLGCFVKPQRVGAHAFRALSGLNFTLNPGEAIALIGKNGAGKSTALQVLAGITPPTEGNFYIKGRVCALLELGSGFNPEFTGRQNITLAGALMGLTREQVRHEEKNIINFADIGEFIDQPVKFYSSGMFVRLAFAVVMAGQPDLLIVDEALAVGDIFFRQKCYARLREMRANGMAVILVTHSSSDAQEFCDKGILLEQGRQTYLGDPTETMVRYYFSVQGCELPNGTGTGTGKTLPQQQGSKTSCPSSLEEASGHPWPELAKYFIEVPLEKQQHVPGAALLRFCLTDEKNQPLNVFEQGSVMRVYTEFKVEFPVEIPATGVTIFNDTGIAIYSKGTVLQGVFCDSVTLVPASIFSCHEITLDIACGEYTLTFGLSTISQDILTKMEYCGYEDWKEGSQRLSTALDIVIVSVVLPLFRHPSRINNFGLVDLPLKSSMIMQTTKQ